jgi:hypothetical protein
MDSKEFMEARANRELIRYSNVTGDELLGCWLKYFPNEPATQYKVTVEVDV